jgi:hypothetical protein
MLAVGAIVLVAVLALGLWMVSRRTANSPPPPVAREPVSMLIADFDNQAKDPVFTGSLEQALNIAIEGASFITTFPRAIALSLTQQLNPGAPLNEASAHGRGP